jgi:hypothetical protein
MLQAGRSWSPDEVDFFNLPNPSSHGRGVDSASNRNEYQEYFWGGGGRRAADA